MSTGFGNSAAALAVQDGSLEKGDRHRDAGNQGNSVRFGARSQSPFPAGVLADRSLFGELFADRVSDLLGQACGAGGREMDIRRLLNLGEQRFGKCA